LLASQFEEVKQKIPVFLGVRILVVEDYKVNLDKVLWDLGALHFSYISQQWVDRYRKVLDESVCKGKTVVRLGEDT